MAKILLTLFAVICGASCSISYAQSSKISDAKIFTGTSVVKNYIKNPSALVNALNVTTSNATFTRDATTNKIDGIASFSCDTSALNGYCEWTLDTISAEDSSSNKTCEFSVDLKGDASLYQLQILDTTPTVLATGATLYNFTDWTRAYVYYACGSARKVRLTQTVAGTSPAVSAGRAFYGPSVSMVQGYPSQLSVVSASTTYPVASSDDFVKADATSASFVVTLPSAVGISGREITIKKIDTSTNTVTINTTSSQTVDGRASGDIVLRRHNNFVIVISDGSNWRIKDKLEHEVKTAQTSGTINGPSVSFQAGSPSVTLGIGEWEVEGSWAVYGGGGGVDVQIFDTSGFFQSDGANTTTTPTAIASQVDGGNNFNYGGYGLTTRVTASTTASPVFRTRIIVTSGTQTVYAVPNILYGTAGTGNSWVAQIRARRIF